MAWSRNKLVKFLMDEGQRAPRRKLRQQPTEWLIREAIAEGATCLACPECKAPFTKTNQECDTGLCERCQNNLNEERDAEVSCPNCGTEFVP